MSLPGTGTHVTVVSPSVNNALVTLSTSKFLLNNSAAGYVVSYSLFRDEVNRYG